MGKGSGFALIAAITPALFTLASEDKYELCHLEDSQCDVERETLVQSGPNHCRNDFARPRGQ